MSVPGLDSRSYTVSQAGNITRIADDLVPANTRDFAYDNLDRLVWDSGASASNPTYSHDANGNRLTRAAGTFPAQGFTYSPGSNRDAAASYDGMGNLRANLAVYIAAGRLASITDPVLGDELQLTYNGLGELAQTVQYHPDCTSTPTLLATEDLSFAPDGRVLSIRTARNVSYETDYLWLDDLPVAQFVDSYDSQGIYQGTDLLYLHPDHLGTPRTATTPWKTIAWRYRSDAFGIPGAETSMQVRLRLPGQIALGVAGIHYNYFRDYEAETGRYLESDPIGLAGGLNTYGYVGGNPLTGLDPYGLWDIGDPLPQGIVDATTGFGDAFLVPELVRDAFDIDGGVNRCSAPYQAGRLTGFAVGATPFALRGAAFLGATRFGRVLNSNRYLRVGPGSRPSIGAGLPAGSRVPRVAVGPNRPDLPNWWQDLRHIDLRSRLPYVPPVGGPESNCDCQ